MKALVIDDDDFMRRLLVAQLSTLVRGEITPCASAYDALTCLTAGHGEIRLIVCDLQMPEMDGVQFLREIARSNFAGELVLISGEDERILQAAERLAVAHGLKVLGALHKPVSVEQIRTTLSQAYKCRTIPRDAVGDLGYDREALRKAIAAGQLCNYYQPKVDLVSARLVGVEALVRWTHPEDGLVLPDRFIGLAEDSGLIDDLTRTVLTTALRDAQRWKDNGLSVPLAVNVSMSNLDPLDFPDFVEREMRDAGLPMTALTLELTESQLMTNPVKSLDTLTRLRLKKIALSLDDFGTGHASLSQLRDLPFTELKVDRSFVRGAFRDETRRTILSASLRMAQRLGMRTVAEGVEDREDWEFLRTTGCDLVQGWFVARPMLPNDLPAWNRSWAARAPELALGRPGR